VRVRGGLRIQDREIRVSPTRTGVAKRACVDELSAALMRLNLETRAFHEAADEGWRSLMTPTVSRSQYVTQLVRVHGFEGPLEAALAYTRNLDLVIDIHERFRAGFIAQDLLAMGFRPLEIARLPQCDIAPFGSPLEALGWTYVSERATLVHDEVRRHLSVRLPEVKDATVYLSSSEHHVGARWQDFGRRVEHAVRSPRMFDELLAGATAAFREWIDWSTRAHVLQRQA
jgi:heme oxygenase (biliverdin-IX-beta and delta-forming)